MYLQPISTHHALLVLSLNRSSSSATRGGRKTIIQLPGGSSAGRGYRRAGPEVTAIVCKWDLPVSDPVLACPTRLQRHITTSHGSKARRWQLRVEDRETAVERMCTFLLLFCPLSLPSDTFERPPFPPTRKITDVRLRHTRRAWGINAVLKKKKFWPTVVSLSLASPAGRVLSLFYPPTLHPPRGCRRGPE